MGAGVLRRIRRRREAGAGGLALFVGLFIAAPCLHNFDHRNDHDHGGGAAAHGHAHGHPHGLPHDRSVPPFDLSIGTASPHDDSLRAPLPMGFHGEGSLSHFGVAITATASFVAPDLIFDLVRSRSVSTPVEPARRPGFDSARPRGPPPT